MRKLVFMLKVNEGPQRENQSHNLEISTHKGARLLITGNQATVLDVTDDPMTDAELQNWYRSRYSGFGMGISILHDGAVSIVPEASQSVQTVSVPDSVGAQSELISHVEPKTSLDEKTSAGKPLEEKTLDEMTYYEMIKFAKLKGIQLPEGRGKAKELYVEVLKAWFKNRDGQ